MAATATPASLPRLLLPSPPPPQVRNFEGALLRMWDIHCQGGGPRDFEVPDQQGQQ